MDSRTKVAAATASVVPFHCVICFDEFNLKDRPPVVLPCGHTFLCQPCSKRLKKCMECREPLFITVPSNSSKGRATPPPPPLMYSRANGRYSPSQQYPSTPPHGSVPPSPPTQVPLPIPKNVVLISMMEAAAMHAKVDERESSSAMHDSEEGSMNADDDGDAYDLNRIISGMATLSGPCGTYAVRDDDILMVVPNHPKKRPQTFEAEEKKQDTFADNEDHILGPVHLRKGQTLQVVDFENGVATLARGAGYVTATSSQLVKVGGPLDSNCRLEGLLGTVVKRGSDLQKELDESNKIEEGLRKEIEAGLEKEPSYPIISDPPAISVADSMEEFDDDFSTMISKENSFVGTRPDPILRTPELNTNTQFIITGRPSDLNTEGTSLSLFGRSSIFNYSPNSIDNADIADSRFPAYRRMPSDENINDLVYGCGTAFLHNTEIFSGNSNRGSNRLEGLALEDNNLQSRSSTHDNHATINASFTSSFDTVDFRTGLSGHRALNTSKSKQVSSPNQRGRWRLMMSEHRGISSLKGPNRSHSPSLRSDC